MRALLAGALVLACAGAGSADREPRWFRAEVPNAGAEAYSAWFADTDREGRTLYFGLSPFWSLWWRSGGDPGQDLIEPGDHLIGRFDLVRERFLEPLRVRAAGPESRSSVWDVLVHSNGRIYFTTFFEEIGSVEADGGDVRFFDGIGTGFNELAEGPDGNVYVTRYSDSPGAPERQRAGAVTILTPGGALVREFAFERRNGVFTAPKSLAVDARTGEIWLNTDTFGAGGRTAHEVIRLSSSGELLARNSTPPELHFVAFDRVGRGWFAEVHAERLRVRVEAVESSPIPIDPLDFVQDIKFAPDGRAALALWSGRAFVAHATSGRVDVQEVFFEKPPDCAPSLLYTAVIRGRSVYATVFCGATILRAPLPR